MAQTVDFLREYLYSHHRLYYFYHFFRQFPHKEYFDNVKDLLMPPNDGARRNFQFRTYGPLNKDKALYYIKIDTSAGLMAFYFRTAKMLTVASFFGFVPVIEWKSLLYQRDNYINDGDNIFDYYFEPICGISAADAVQSYNVALADYSHSIIPESRGPINYIPSNERDALYAKAVNKFITLNSATQAHVSGKINNILEGKKTLGIHVRGGSFKDNLLGHPVAIDPTEHIAEAKKAISEYGFERIFLATDEEETVATFKKVFGSMVVSYDDVTRTAGDNFDLPHLALSMRGSRPDHGYLMGLEVVTDVYTLAACQGLIAGMSNVPLAAVYANGDNYELKHFISKGIAGDGTPGIEIEKSRAGQYKKEYDRLKKLKEGEHEKHV